MQSDDEIWLTAAWLHFQKTHQVDTFNKMCGLRQVPNEAKSLEINIPQAALDHMAAKYPGKNRVVIHPAGRDKGKKWPTEYWQQLVNKFRADGIEVIAIGMNDWLGDSSHHLDNVIEEFDLPPLYTMALLQHCNLLVSACSGPIQLAAISDCAILGLYSLMPPETRLPYRHGKLGWNAMGIMPSCEFAPCMEKMVEAEPEFEWSQAAYDKMAAGMSLGQIMSTWCLNEAEPYSCMASISVDAVYSTALNLLENQ
jgi:ADP-heptose:LPS heptosyltransferase